MVNRGDASGTPWSADLARTAVTAIAAGLGGLAFVTFIGGAITAARFRGAGFSGTKVIAVTPRADLLAAGAELLVLPIIVAAVVALVYQALHTPKWRHTVLTTLAFGGPILGSGLVAVLAASNEGAWSTGGWVAVGTLLLIACAGWRAVGRLDARPISTHPSPAPTTAVALLFLVVALFTATLSCALGYARPVVHAMAILGPGGDGGLVGIYVGESASAIYIGHDGAILEIPRARVCAAAIGLTHPLEEARSEGLTVLAALEASEAALGSSVNDARRCTQARSSAQSPDAAVHAP